MAQVDELCVARVQDRPGRSTNPPDQSGWGRGPFNFGSQPETWSMHEGDWGIGCRIDFGARICCSHIGESPASGYA